jgi:hypothetical protein
MQISINVNVSKLLNENFICSIAMAIFIEDILCPFWHFTPSIIHCSSFLFVRYRVLILSNFSVLLYESFLGHFTKIPEWNNDKIIPAGKTDVLGNKPVPLLLIPPLTQDTLIWDRTWTSAMIDLRLTTFLRQKCLFIAPFRITKDYTLNRWKVITYSQ